MVCNRCKTAVRIELEKSGLHPLSVELGEIEIQEYLSKDKLEVLDQSLKHQGFELIDDRKGKIIEKIKTEIIHLIHESGKYIDVNLSDFLSGKLNYDYTYLSNLFSEVEGTTIEKYFISHKIEKAKELLMYDELSLSQIAEKLGYSSVAYLSNQFKKIAGFSPSFYKSLREHKRKNIDEL
jgi:YesN/AraC family two-component response regulator